MRYFIYTRKSTDSEERQVLSIEAQLAELHEFAQKEKLEIAALLSEAQTAKEPGRTVFGEMLKRIEKGEAEGILAWHPDRLARNSIDGGRIVYLLDTGKLKDLKFPTFWFDSTPQGKFMLSIAFGQSKYYIDNLAENIKRGHRAKLRKGIWPSFAPLGYLNNHHTKGIDVDQERARYIKKAYELYSTGEYTLKFLAEKLSQAGLKSKDGNNLSVSRVQHMLKNTFYIGIFSFNGETYEGTHEPIISKKLFDAVQQVMANRGKKKRKRKHEFAFSGFMHCGNCGCMITAEKQKGHHYYRCTKKKQTCEEKYLREENLVEQMKSVIQKVSIPISWKNKMLLELTREKTKNEKQNKVFVQNLQNQKIEIEKKLDKLLDLFIETKAITPEEYQAKKQKFINEKIEIENKISDFEQKGNNRLEPIKEIIYKACQAKKIANSGDLSNIREFLKNIGSNFILKGKKLQFSPQIGWRALVEREPNTSWRRREDSNL